jgi:hypothetical protein
MHLKYFLTAVFFLFPFKLFAQQFVDVFPDKTYIQESYSWGDGIYKINPDLSFEIISIPLSDKTSLDGKPRPKIRFDTFWISDGKKIYSKPLDATHDQEWEPVKLPDGIDKFNDFEIISDKEAMLCGVFWKTIDYIPLRYDMHFIYNYKTGLVTKTIESLDPKNIPIVPKNIPEDIKSKITSDISFNLIKIFDVYLCRFDSKILIVGKYSGLVTVLDISNGKSHVFEIIPKDEMPSEPEKAVNNGKAIAWIGPLSGDDVLICCRMWVVPDKDPSRPASMYCFRTLNLKTGRIAFEGTEYRDQMAESYLTLYEENGRLLPARNVIKERAKHPEQGSE